MTHEASPVSRQLNISENRSQTSFPTSSTFKANKFLDSRILDMIGNRNKKIRARELADEEKAQAVKD